VAPLDSSDTDVLSNFKALLRWHNAHRGLAPPLHLGLDRLG
jgi:hypothetical protein